MQKRSSFIQTLLHLSRKLDLNVAVKLYTSLHPRKYDMFFGALSSTHNILY